MPIAPGDNAFDYRYERASSLAGTLRFGARCYGRECNSLASQAHSVRSASLSNRAERSDLLLCPTHGEALASDIGTFMGVVSVYRDMGSNPHCEYRGCSDAAAPLVVVYAGLARTACLFLCPKHRPVFTVRRLRPRR